MTAIGGSQDDGDVRYAFPKRKSQPGSAQRNSIAIRDELAPLLEHWTDSDDGRPFHLLELASGQGEQIAALASRLALSSKQFNFHPTEADEASCREVDQRCEGLTVVVGCKKLDIDVESDWQSLRISLQGVLGAPFDAVLVCNVVHIVPWATVETLFRHINPDAGLVRRNGGRVIVYGAFNEHGRYTSNGNQNVSRLAFRLCTEHAALIAPALCSSTATSRKKMARSDCVMSKRRSSRWPTDMACTLISASKCQREM